MMVMIVGISQKMFRLADLALGDDDDDDDNIPPTTVLAAEILAACGLLLNQRAASRTIQAEITLRRINRNRVIAISNFEHEACQSIFRFRYADMFRLHRTWGVEAHYRASNGNVFTGEELFILFLRRFTYPSRFTDLEFSQFANRTNDQLCRG